MSTTYDGFVRLWNDYQDGVNGHECPGEEFSRCEVCEHSVEARALLSTKLDRIMDLLQREHDALDALADSVIQEVPTPRPEHLQAAMLRALAVLKC